ncbi:MAG: hypothetical protein R6V21_05540 [Pelovirga sp.]
MFDNLIARAIVPVTIAVTGFVVFGCIFLYSFIKVDMTAEAVRHVDGLAETVVRATHYAMMEDDRASLRNILANVNRLAEVERIRIYDQLGQPKFSDLEGVTAPGSFSVRVDEWSKNIVSDNGQDRGETLHQVDHDYGFIAVNMPILNEPKCSTAACHFHAEDEPILGFLSLGFSSAHLEKTLALLKTRMIAFSLMVLFLTVVGVAALLRINLFLPILRLTHEMERAVNGVAEPDLPKSNRKLGKLGRDFRLLVKQRDEALLNKEATTAARGSDDRPEQADSRRRASAGHEPTTTTGSGEN